MSQKIAGVTISSLCVLYANCIMEETINFSRVPNVLRPDVAFVLVSAGAADLITDEEIKSSSVIRYNEACNNKEV